MLAIPEYGLLRVTGADAKSFLQNQLTNDVHLLANSPSDIGQLTGWCNPKGRLLGLFRLWQDADKACYYLRVPTELIPTVLPRLRLFVMRAEVVIEDLSHDFSGYWSAQQTNNSGLAFNALSGWEYWLTTGEEVQPSVPSTSREQAEIALGLPEIYASSSESFIPQMVNLDHLDGMSFKKGCFPGQEITARMQYRGQIKQRMFHATVPNAHTTPVATTPIQDANGQTIGQWVRAIDTSQALIGLAVLRFSALSRIVGDASDTNRYSLQLIDNETLIISIDQTMRDHIISTA